jgi:CBS domain-containing protein
VFVRDILSRKGDFVATIPPGMTVRELLSVLAEHNVGAVVVSSDGVRMEGIVSERDIVRAIPVRDSGLLDSPVSEIMTPDVEITAPEERIDRLMRTMTDHRIRHVPVIVDGRLAGLVSIGDVVKYRMDELESEKESLVGYISSGG